eukprot:15462291-Alexandrium_andersonii.AAC.1
MPANSASPELDKVVSCVVDQRFSTCPPRARASKRGPRSSEAPGKAGARVRPNAPPPRPARGKGRRPSGAGGSNE